MKPNLSFARIQNMTVIPLLSCLDFQTLMGRFTREIVYNEFCQITKLDIDVGEMQDIYIYFIANMCNAILFLYDKVSMTCLGIIIVTIYDRTDFRHSIDTNVQTLIHHNIKIISQLLHEECLEQLKELSLSLSFSLTPLLDTSFSTMFFFFFFYQCQRTM